MRPGAVIFDVYATLLEIGPAHVPPEAGWEALFHDTFRRSPELAYADFSEACRKLLARQHERARSLGISFPEVVWPSVMRELVPELSAFTAQAQDEFIFRHSQLTRATSLNPDAAALLPQLGSAGVQLGIASNAQAYTLRELQTSFAAAGLSWTELFDPELCFWSFKHGFSKPNPHVFQILTARLVARGLRPEEILMVGDRLDNDIEPAEAHGWGAWWLNANPGARRGGSWEKLLGAWSNRWEDSQPPLDYRRQSDGSD